VGESEELEACARFTIGRQLSVKSKINDSRKTVTS
jgi:hypothetical protein